MILGRSAILHTSLSTSVAMFHLRRLNKTLQTPSLSRSFARYMSSSVNNPCGSDFGIERMHTGPRMSKIVKHNNVVYLCGQTSDFPEGVTELSVAEQTQSCLDKIDDLLAEAGSSKEHILRNEIWLSDMSMFAEMNEVYDKWVVPGKTPARACGESKLARPQLFVEFIVTAAVPGPQE